jgi:hypothetical protein
MVMVGGSARLALESDLPNLVEFRTAGATI